MSSSSSVVNTAAARARAHLRALPPASRSRLKAIRETIRAAAPGAVEHFSYGIPGFRLDGQPLYWYAAWTHHCSLYPMTAGVREALGPKLAGYKMSKGTIQLPSDRPLPIALIKRLIKARLAEIRKAKSKSRPASAARKKHTRA